MAPLIYELWHYPLKAPNPSRAPQSYNHVQLELGRNLLREAQRDQMLVHADVPAHLASSALVWGAVYDLAVSGIPGRFGDPNTPTVVTPGGTVDTSLFATSAQLSALVAKVDSIDLFRGNFASETALNIAYPAGSNRKAGETATVQGEAWDWNVVANRWISSDHNPQRHSSWSFAAGLLPTPAQAQVNAGVAFKEGDYVVASAGGTVSNLTGNPDVIAGDVVQVTGTPATNGTGWTNVGHRTLDAATEPAQDRVVVAVAAVNAIASLPAGYAPNDFAVNDLLIIAATDRDIVARTNGTTWAQTPDPDRNAFPCKLLRNEGVALEGGVFVFWDAGTLRWLGDALVARNEVADAKEATLDALIDASAGAHDATATYVVDAQIWRGGRLLRAAVGNGPGAYDASDWETVVGESGREIFRVQSATLNAAGWAALPVASRDGVVYWLTDRGVVDSSDSGASFSVLSDLTRAAHLVVTSESDRQYLWDGNSLEPVGTDGEVYIGDTFPATAAARGGFKIFLVNNRAYTFDDGYFQVAV